MHSSAPRELGFAKNWFATENVNIFVEMMTLFISDNSTKSFLHPRRSCLIHNVLMTSQQRWNESESSWWTFQSLLIQHMSNHTLCPRWIHVSWRNFRARTLERWKSKIDQYEAKSRPTMRSGLTSADTHMWSERELTGGHSEGKGQR